MGARLYSSNTISCAQSCRTLDIAEDSIKVSSATAVSPAPKDESRITHRYRHTGPKSLELEHFDDESENLGRLNRGYITDFGAQELDQVQHRLLQSHICHTFKMVLFDFVHNHCEQRIVNALTGLTEVQL